MSKIIKLREYFVAWLLVGLGGFGGAFLLGLPLGFVIGLIGTLLEYDMRTIMPLTTIVGFILGLAVSFVMFTWVVNKLIVQKVEERVQQAMQAQEKQDL